MVDFSYPLVLLFYFLVLIATIYIFLKNQKRLIFSSTNTKVRKNLFKRIDIKRIILKDRLVFLSLVLMIFAASGPKIGTRIAPIERTGIDLVFAIDVSSSMKAEDVKPSRIQKAKFEISQIINRLKGDRVAIIVFAGSSHLYLPLTTDYDAALLFLDKIDTNMIPTQGTSLSSALNTGINSFIDDEAKYKVLTLITDGEDHEGMAIDIAREANSKGMTIHTVSVGTVEGALIPEDLQTGVKEFKRDKNGKLITTSINESILKEIAQAGGGKYIKFENKPSNYSDLISAIDSMEKRKIDVEIFSEYQDYYQIFTMLSLICLFLGTILGDKKIPSQNWKGRYVN